MMAIQSAKVIEYLYPNRPDLFNELSLVQTKIKEIETKSDNLEHDVTSLKFGLSQKR